MYSDTGGDGPVVVLLHGVLMNGSVWRDIVDGLRGHYRCIVPELPFGAHRRPMPDGADISLASIARAIAEFLVELDLHDVTLACNDWGGAQLVISSGNSDRVAKLGRERNVPVRLEAKRGKGSHTMLYYGDRKTVVKDRRKEVGAGLLSAMIRQLGLDPNDFR